MKKNNFMTGAVVLSIGAVLAKVFSAVYRIGLTRILGGEGIGLYQLIFPFYSLCVVFATAGLPMAISKVVAKNTNAQLSVVKKCLIFTSLIALMLTAILLISSGGLAAIQGQKQLSICYVILAPTIILVTASSVLRGYFQGKHNFVPSAVSNILEQLVKLVVGLILSLSLISAGLISAIIGAVVGIVVSEVVSLVVLILYFKHKKQKEKRANIGVGDLIKDIMPITLTNIILPIATFVDSVLVVNLLSVNFSNHISIFLYGLESGAVSSIVGLPTIFSFAIASVILPNLTMRQHKINNDFKLSSAIKVVLIITIPFVICFTLIPNRLINILYGGRLNGYGISGANIASRLLVWSGFGVVFLALNQLFSSSLQAIEHRFVTIRNLSLSVFVKFVIELIFLPSKMLNIYALAISNTVCYICAMTLNYVELKQHFKLKINYDFATKLTFCNLIMVLSMLVVLTLGNSPINTILALLVGMIVYFVMLWKVKICDKKMFAMLKYKT